MKVKVQYAVREDGFCDVCCMERRTVVALSSDEDIETELCYPCICAMADKAIRKEEK